MAQATEELRVALVALRRGLGDAMALADDAGRQDIVMSLAKVTGALLRTQTLADDA